MTKIRKKNFLPRRFYTIFAKKCSNLRPFLSITFPQGFQIFKYFGHWISGSVGKRTVKQSEQMRRKKSVKNFLHNFQQKNSNLRPFLSITFCQGFRISIKLGHWTSGSGGKKTFKRSEQMKKKIRKQLFLPCQFYTLYEQKFSNLRPLLSITFPQ